MSCVHCLRPGPGEDDSGTPAGGLVGLTTILLDLDGTLIDQPMWYRDSCRELCEPVRARHGVDVDALSDSLRRHAGALWKGVPTREYCAGIGMGFVEGLWGSFDGPPDPPALSEWAEGYRVESWKRALRDQGVEDDASAEALAVAWPVSRPMRHLFLPGTEEALTELGRDYRLALVTNGVPAVQRQKVAVTGLDRVLDGIFVAGDLGIGKPDARHFQHALDTLGETTDTCVMVGDRLATDILGAVRLGMMAVWINPDGDDPGAVRPDAQIEDMRGLPAVLAGRG